jgi:hypothetical protein
MSGDYYPLEQDWYSGTIKENSRSSRSLFIELANGEEVYCPDDWSIITLSPGSHYCRLGMPQFQEVQVRIALNEPGRSTSYIALELRCDAAPIHRTEISTVTPPVSQVFHCAAATFLKLLPGQIIDAAGARVVECISPPDGFVSTDRLRAYRVHGVWTAFQSLRFRPV